jgi:hypothetical protein
MYSLDSALWHKVVTPRLIERKFRDCGTGTHGKRQSGPKGSSAATTNNFTDASWRICCGRHQASSIWDHPG